jgi:hypothetical protein
VILISDGGTSSAAEIADDGLVELSLGAHRSAGKNRDFDDGKFLRGRAGRQSATPDARPDAAFDRLREFSRLLEGRIEPHRSQPRGW